jgi:hypothetical protein
VLKFVQGNRLVNQQRANRIMEAIKNGAQMPPILVDRETLYIIDGQHRYKAAKQLWDAGVSYTLKVILMDFENPVESAIVYNNTSKAWVLGEYVQARMVQHEEDENNNYIRLWKFIEDHDLYLSNNKPNYNAACALLGASRDSIKRNKLTFKRDMDFAEIVLEELRAMAPAMGVDSLLKEWIVRGWILAREEIRNRMQFSEYLTIVHTATCPIDTKKDAWKNCFLKVLENRRK